MNPSLRYPDLMPEVKSGRWTDWLRVFGPGAIIASVSISAGETIWASRSGAVFGYALLWCFLYGIIAKYVQVYAGTRYMVLTGEHPMERWAHLPGPRAWFPWLMTGLIVVAFPVLVAAVSVLMNTLLVRIIYGRVRDHLLEVHVFSTIWFVLILGMALVQRYRRLERVLLCTVMALVMCVAVFVLMSTPEWSAVLKGLLLPALPVPEDWVIRDYPAIASGSRWAEIAACMGAIGGGAHDYIGYLSIMREKSWGMIGHNGRIFPARPMDGVNVALDAENVACGKRWLRAPAVDTLMSFGCVFVVATGFSILGANILHSQHLIPDRSRVLSDQAPFFAQVHPAFVLLYHVAILLVFFGVLYGAFELYSRTFWECARVLRPTRPMDYQRTRRGILAYTCAAGLGVSWWIYFAQKDALELLKLPLAIGGTLACGLWCFAMIWTDRKFLPVPLRMSGLLQWVLLAAGVVLTVVGVRGVWDGVAELMR